MAAHDPNPWDALYAKTDLLVWGKEPAGFLGSLIPRLKSLLPAHPLVLDAGAGEGRNLALIESLGGRIWACDSSRNGLRKIGPLERSHAARAQCRLERLPFASGVFDLIVASDVLETLRHPRPVLQEIVRVLKPRGLFLSNIPGLEDGISRVDMIPLGNGTFLYQGTYFYQFLTEGQASELLREHHFDIEWVEDCQWVEDPHPAFRATKHNHRSHVFLCRKSAY